MPHLTPSWMADTHEIPEFYKKRQGFLAEVSWSVDNRGKPTCVEGQLRYPIAYVGHGALSSSGVCASYSAPFVSDAERHGISQQADWFNDEVIQQCDEAFVRVLRERLIPKYGPSMLSLVCHDDMEPKRRRSFMELLLEQGVIPIVGASRRGNQTQLVRHSRSTTSKWSFVIPCFSWDMTRVSPVLAAACPVGQEQIHPKTPETVISDLVEDFYHNDRLLSNSSVDSPYAVLDETDIDEMIYAQTHQDLDFPWTKKWERQFAIPRGAKVLLDVLHEREKNEPIDDSEREKIKEMLSIPDERGNLAPLSELFSSRELTDFPPEVDPPSLIHRNLREHPLLRRRNWKLPSFGFAELLDDIDLDGYTENARTLFWKWTKANWKRIPMQVRRSFARLPIWPIVSAEHVTLAELCYPKSRESRKILQSVLALPARDVLRLSGVRTGGRGTLAIRTKLSADDVESWFSHRSEGFSVGQHLNKAEKADFEQFETEAATLAKDRDAISFLRDLQSEALGLDRTSTLRRCSDLHRETPEVGSLELCPEDLIHRSQKRLDRVFEPRRKPSVDALERAFQHPPNHLSSWLTRLVAYVKATEREDTLPDIEEVACILVEGQWHKPCELALQGRRGDFWGSWKKTIPVTGRSAGEQGVLQKVGVTPGEPTPEHSHGFFLWLQHHTEVLPKNLHSVFRHFEHPKGVLSWWDEYPNIRCLPVRGTEGLDLVSLADARRKNSRVFIDDFPELSKKVQKGTDLAFVVDRDPKLPFSIVGCIRDYPTIKRLSHLATKPIRVTGVGEAEQDRKLDNVLVFLQSRKFKKEIHSRLAQWGIPSSNLRHDWFKRVSAIQQVEVYTEVTVVFRVGKQECEISLPSQFEEASRTLHIGNSEGYELTGLLDAIAEYVFKSDAPKMAKAAFGRAVLAELPHAEDIGPVILSHVDEEGEGGTVRGDETFEEVAEAQMTHGTLFDPRDRNTPKPQELSPRSEALERPTRTNTQGSSTGRTRLPSNLEEKHKQQLKETYAWHCQVCLATKTPDELAPEGSYVFIQENRRHLIQAHHPDQVHAGGERHGGNLLVVCQQHHLEIGDAITRSDIIDALRAGSKYRGVSFNSDSGTTVKLKGVVVDVPVRIAENEVSFFFADEHRDYWIESDKLVRS